jgi:hypothetical protein
MHPQFSFPAQEKIVFENIPQPGFWLEGNAGPWGPGNPFYESQTPLRKKLISYLNSYPSTLSQLEDIFDRHAENIKEDVTALLEAKMIRAIDTLRNEEVYAPTFAILSVSDLELLNPLMMNVAENYADNINENREELDKILIEAGLDKYYRLPVFLAFVRDKFFYEYMEQKHLFPLKDGLCPKNGKGNFYGVEPYQPLSAKQPYGITHSMKGDWSFVYIYPYFKSDSLFETWGFKELWEAKDVFSKIMKTVKRDKPVKESKIARKFQGKEIQEHIPAILDYLIKQKALTKSEQGYINTSARLDKRTMKDLEKLSFETAMHIAEFIGSVELANFYPKTTSGQNNVSIAEFREAVAWQTIWATAGFLKEKGFFPDLSENQRELFIFKR